MAHPRAKASSSLLYKTFPTLGFLHAEMPPLLEALPSCTNKVFGGAGYVYKNAMVQLVSRSIEVI